MLLWWLLSWLPVASAYVSEDGLRLTWRRLEAQRQELIKQHMQLQTQLDQEESSSQFLRQVVHRLGNIGAQPQEPDADISVLGREVGTLEAIEAVIEKDYKRIDDLVFSLISVGFSDNLIKLVQKDAFEPQPGPQISQYQVDKELGMLAILSRNLSSAMADVKKLSAALHKGAAYTCSRQRYRKAVQEAIDDATEQVVGTRVIGRSEFAMLKLSSVLPSVAWSKPFMETRSNLLQSRRSAVAEREKDGTLGLIASHENWINHELSAWSQLFCDPADFKALESKAEYLGISSSPAKQEPKTEDWIQAAHRNHPSIRARLDEQMERYASHARLLNSVVERLPVLRHRTDAEMLRVQDAERAHRRRCGGNVRKVYANLLFMTEIVLRRIAGDRVA